MFVRVTFVDWDVVHVAGELLQRDEDVVQAGHGPREPLLLHSGGRHRDVDEQRDDFSVLRLSQCSLSQYRSDTNFAGSR